MKDEFTTELGFRNERGQCESALVEVGSLERTLLVDLGIVGLGVSQDDQCAFMQAVTTNRPLSRNEEVVLSVTEVFGGAVEKRGVFRDFAGQFDFRHDACVAGSNYQEVGRVALR